MFGYTIVAFVFLLKLFMLFGHNIVCAFYKHFAVGLG